MTVVGRGGIGKSAMVCRLLKFLEAGLLPDDLGTLEVDGIAYLSNARSSHPVTVPELYRALSQLLPEETAQRIDALYRDPQSQTRDVLESLSQVFLSGRKIVLLDNFEDSVDANAQIRSAELNEVLRGLLELPFYGLKVIITTRVAPVDLAEVEPGRQRRLDLDKGLPHPFAEDALRAMDQEVWPGCGMRPRRCSRKPGSEPGAIRARWRTCTAFSPPTATRRCRRSSTTPGGCCPRRWSRCS